MPGQPYRVTAQRGGPVKGRSSEGHRFRQPHRTTARPVAASWHAPVLPERPLRRVTPQGLQIQLKRAFFSNWLHVFNGFHFKVE
jgi:hypothetical protein